jgi:hypothetical protein
MIRKDEGIMPTSPKFQVILREIEDIPYRYPQRATGSPEYLGPGQLFVDSEASIWTIGDHKPHNPSQRVNRAFKSRSTETNALNQQNPSQILQFLGHYRAIWHNIA